MNSLKVLHAVAGMDPEMGGVCKAVRMIISGLAELGVHNETISLDPADAPYLGADLFPLHAVGTGRTPWRYNPELLRWLEENIERFNVVIVHGLWLYNSYAVRKVVADARKKDQKAAHFFVMPHGMLDPYFQVAAGRKLKAIRNLIFWQLTERTVIADADGLLFTCEMEKVLARKTFTPYRPKQELVVGLGVEKPPVFSATMRDVFQLKAGLNNRPYLLYISRIHEKKGTDMLVEAYIGLKKNHPDMPALVIAGPGIETDYGRQVQQLAAPSTDIYFPGMLTGDAKWGAFYGCEAFVLPSHQENFGIAVVEAMACAKPVLISNQINIWKEIADARGGLVADDTVAKTREMLEKWLTTGDKERQQLGANGRMCFEKHFAIPSASERLLAAFNQA